MKIENEKLIEVFMGEDVKVGEKTFQLVEEGEWTQDYKYQYADLIFTDGNKTYKGSVSRSGSPFTDWYYDDFGDQEVVEVEHRTVTYTKEEWLPVEIEREENGN